MKKALICGISGQDGAYLAQLLLEKGYTVCGTSRDAQMSSFENLNRLGIRERVKLQSMSLTDFRSVLQVLAKIEPDEVYNLAGQSSVGLYFEQPVETLESITIGTLNLLEAIRFTGGRIKLYNAGSSECFGDTGDRSADESTPFRPRSPYAVAKAAAFWEVANYREAYADADENRRFAKWIAEKLNRSVAPVTVLAPEKGVSSVDSVDQPFHDEEVDQVLIDHLQESLNLSDDRKLMRLPFHINDPEFADALVQEFLRLVNLNTASRS